MRVYYNEWDKYCAQWLRNLMAANLIPAGDVDERDIRDVRPSDLEGYDQCHFFAGIGGWPYALMLAGWPDDRPVWSASCPCQPLSVAGQRKGHLDERHLWPAFFALVTERRPATLFGEQVASKDGREWLAGIRIDLEGAGYACGGADLCAAGVGAPHIRQRLFWVAEPAGERWNGQHTLLRAESRNGATSALPEIARGGCAGEGVAHPGRANGSGRRDELAGSGAETDSGGAQHKLGGRSAASGLGDSERERLRVPGRGPDECTTGGMQDADGERERLRSNPWAASELIACADGKSRRIEPGTFPLAHGVSARVGKLRAYGNAIVPQVAAQFIEAYLEAA